MLFISQKNLWWRPPKRQKCGGKSEKDIEEEDIEEYWEEENLRRKKNLIFKFIPIFHIPFLEICLQEEVSDLTMEETARGNLGDSATNQNNLVSIIIKLLLKQVFLIFMSIFD